MTPACLVVLELNSIALPLVKFKIGGHLLTTYLSLNIKRSFSLLGGAGIGPVGKPCAIE
jgi:hypothetical protein